MKELKAPDKIVRQMATDGAVEVNKATGAASPIGARDAPDAPAADNVGNGLLSKSGVVADRVKSEYRARNKRKTAKKFNEEIRARERGEPSRLRFADAERADPALAKPIIRADKAAARAETARAKIPTRKQLSVQRVFDGPTGKAKTRLSFHETEKPANGKLRHAISRPGREAALAAHGEVDRSNADGNTGVQSARFAERRVEGAARKIGDGYRSIKTRPYRAAAKADARAVKADVDALYQRALRKDPELANGNILQKSLFKRKIKRDYAKAYRKGNIQTAQTTAAAVKKGAGKARNTARNAAKFAAKHRKGLALAG